MDDKTRTLIMKEAIELFDEGYKLKKIMEVISERYPDPIGEARSYVAKCGIEMYVSLVMAIDRAGGSGWPAERVCKTTVMDLFSALATNGVRFHYVRK